MQMVNISNLPQPIDISRESIEYRNYINPYKSRNSVRNLQIYESFQHKVSFDFKKYEDLKIASSLD